MKQPNQIALTDKPAKLSGGQYKFICELLWGGAPVDRGWAESSKLFQENASKILEKYPMLDKSFFDEYKREKKG